MTRVKGEAEVRSMQEAVLDDSDFLCEIVQTDLQRFLDSEMTAQLGAELHERSDDRLGCRCGSIERRLTTRVGRITL